jgi:hypothetical protein
MRPIKQSVVGSSSFGIRPVFVDFSIGQSAAQLDEPLGNAFGLIGRTVPNEKEGTKK